jgi:glycosyltransferase involved in cell wall biosynthesis
VLVVQFNYGFFDFSALSEFLVEQTARRTKVVMTLHSTADLAHAPDRRLSLLIPALRSCHRILVHSIGDLNRLKSLGLTHNVALFPLGVLEPPVRTQPRRSLFARFNTKFVLATYGFFLPHKGLLELIDVVSNLRKSGCHVSLHMVNAQYPVSESQALISQARNKIDALGLKKIITLTTEFLTDAQSLALLQRADLVVYPYQETGESASAAVRFGLAARRPVAVTPLAIFDDVEAAVFRLPGTSVDALTSGLRTLIEALQTSTIATQEKLVASQAWCQAHRYPALAARLERILKS